MAGTITTWLEQSQFVWNKHKLSGGIIAQAETWLDVKENDVVRARANKRGSKLSDSYFDLVKLYPLRSIQTEAELDAAQAVIDDLLTRELDAGGEAYLDALSDLVILYEQDHHAIAPLPPGELLAFLLTERGMSQADLVRKARIAKATVSELVSGKRPFTVDHMQRIAAAFGVSAEVFLPKAEGMRR